MITYLITYETIIPDSTIVDKIRSFQLWARLMTNVWMIKTDSNRDSVMAYLTSNPLFVGRLLVIRVTNDWIAKNLTQEVINWMQGGL